MVPPLKIQIPNAVRKNPVPSPTQGNIFTMDLAPMPIINPVNPNRSMNPPVTTKPTSRACVICLRGVVLLRLLSLDER